MAYARVKVYKGPRGNCYVAYRGSNILHDWVINARLKSYKIKEKVKLTSIKHFTRSIAANMHEIYTKYIREFTRGDYKNENGQCVHKGFFEHMMLFSGQGATKVKDSQMYTREDYLRWPLAWWSDSVQCRCRGCMQNGILDRRPKTLLWTMSKRIEGCKVISFC